MSERAYLGLLQDILDNGVDRGDRTGTGTRSVFGRQIRFDLSKGFPLLTTKKVFLRGVVEELIWFLSGSTNAKVLEDKGVNIWKQWGDPETRELGPVYGWQWRRFDAPYSPSVGEALTPFDIGNFYVGTNQPQPTDQIVDLVNRLKADPNSRRHLVVAWNPNQVDDMALPPCHCLFQFYVRPLSYKQRCDLWHLPPYRDADPQASGVLTLERLAQDGIPEFALDCQLYQRSADVFLGVPFNIASYSLLTIMLAQQLGYAPGDYVHTFGDVHLYHNHFDQAREQLSREPRAFPQMKIAKAADIFSYHFEDFELVGYDPHPTIKAPVAV